MQNEFIPRNVLIPYFGLDVSLAGVEIGVMTASGSVSMLDKMPNLKLYCIDPWVHVDQEAFELGGYTQEQHDINFEHARKRLAFYGDRAVILKKKSDDALIFIPPGVDFVYIDGHHQFDQVMKDIQNYLPKIRKGGIIAGHDYLQVPDVTWAVDKLFKKEDIHTGEDFTWWVYL